MSGKINHIHIHTYIRTFLVSKIDLTTLVAHPVSISKEKFYMVFKEYKNVVFCFTFGAFSSKCT